MSRLFDVDPPPSVRKSKGSHVTWGGWEPRVCVVCHRRVTLQHSAFHGGMPGRPFSIHVECGGLAEAHRRLMEAE